MLSVREITEQDIELLADYWFTADDAFLLGMGVDLAKMPTREAFTKRLGEQIGTPYKERKAYCIIWLLEGKPLGHNNVNEIVFGQKAHVHLHMWKADVRQKGLGPQFMKMALPFYFENLKLKVLYCEPSATNPAPNKALPKVGFEFVKEYKSVPSDICSEQLIRQWQMTYEKYKSLK
jgi:RimJ/RimL family protein N-acetyltransferase